MSSLYLLADAAAETTKELATDSSTLAIAESISRGSIFHMPDVGHAHNRLKGSLPGCCPHPTSNFYTPDKCRLGKTNVRDTETELSRSSLNEYLQIQSHTIDSNRLPVRLKTHELPFHSTRHPIRFCLYLHRQSFFCSLIRAKNSVATTPGSDLDLLEI